MTKEARETGDGEEAAGPLEGLTASALFGADPDWECAHEWLVRPESDTRQCQICGDER